MNKVNYAIRDENAKAVFYVLLTKKKRITSDMFFNYWKDVHGPICARLPGQYQYWQFHLAHNEGSYWQTTNSIECKSLEEDQIDGIAELTFLTEEDRQKWFNASAVLMSDEYNLFSKAIGYVTKEGNSKTYVDHIENGEQNGNLNIVKYHVLVKKHDFAKLDDFQKYIAGSFANTFVKTDLILKFKLHLFEEHDNSEKLPPAPGVSHYEALEKQYQAAFEIAFKNHIDMEKFFASQEYAATMQEQTKYIKQINAFAERDVYTFVYNGNMTLAGQRSSTIAKLITDIGAINQLQDDILNLLFGKVV